jgi:hypothetical protein
MKTIRAFIEKQLNDRLIALVFDGAHQRRIIVSAYYINIRSPVDEKPSRFVPFMLQSEKQRCSLVVRTHDRAMLESVDPRPMIKQVFNHFLVANSGGSDKGGSPYIVSLLTLHPCSTRNRTCQFCPSLRRCIRTP